jgi:hypothetical protein
LTAPLPGLEGTGEAQEIRRHDAVSASSDLWSRPSNDRWAWVGSTLPVVVQAGMGVGNQMARSRAGGPILYYLAGAVPLSAPLVSVEPWLSKR